MSYQPYVSCTRCSGKAQPGTVALLRYLMEKFPKTGSLGIYNCRNVAGSSSMSQHACGRAGDSKIPTSGGNAIPSIGNPVVQFLYQYSTQFGITQQIYNRVIYDAKTPRGRYYGGVHPHRDHVHWAQTSSKAASLTYQQIVAIAGPSGGSGPTPPDTGDDMPSDAVEGIQRNLNKQGFTGSDNKPLTVDGEWGPNTETAHLKMVTAAKKDLTGGGITEARVKELIAAHAKVKPSTSVHPHAHTTPAGTTGPAK